MATKKTKETKTEKIFKARARLLERYRKILNEFFIRKQDEKGLNQLTLKQRAAEIERDIESMPLTAKDGEEMEYRLNAPLQRAIDRVASATKEIYDEAASESVPLKTLQDDMGKALDTHQQKYQALYDKYRVDPDKQNLVRESRRNEIFYEMWLVFIKMFRKYIKDIFEPEDGGEKTSSKPGGTPLAIRVVYHKKTVQFVKQPTASKPGSGAKKYTCNGWNHKPGCTCGWGPRPGEGSKPTGKPPAGKPETVTKKVWIPAIYIVPRINKPPVVI